MKPYTESTVSWENAEKSAERNNVQVYPQSLIIMEDGLWVLNDLRVGNDNVLKEMDSKDDILFKVPE